MQKSQVVIFKSKNALVFLRESYSFLIMYLVYIIGVAVGAAFVKRAVFSSEQIKAFFGLDRAFQGFWSEFYSFIINWIPSVFLVSLFGMSMAGVAIIPFLVAIKGIEYGVLSGYLYSQLHFNGIIYALLLVIPSVLFAAFCLFFVAKESFSFSLKLLKHAAPEPRADYLYPSLTLFCRKILLYVLFILFAALLDATLNAAFFDSVKFM